LHRSIDVRFIEAEVSTYRDYIETSESPTAIVSLKSFESNQTWLIEIGRHLAFAFIDSMLGGSIETGGSVDDREFSAVETRLLERVVHSLLIQLVSSVGGADQLQIRHVVSDAKLITEGTSNEAVVLISFEISIESLMGLVQLCVPWNIVAVDPHESAISDRGLNDRAKTVARSIPVSGTVKIANLKLPAKDLATLGPGDLILTETDANGEIPLDVAGVEVFRGKAGQHHGRKVIRLTTPSPRISATE
jgi:flagellar motor switch protein FliM